MSTTEVIDALAEELASDEAIQTSARGEEEDPSELALDLGVVASIIAIVRFTAIDGPLVPKLWRAIRRSRPGELVIKSPTRTIRIDYNDEITEADPRGSPAEAAPPGRLRSGGHKRERAGGSERPHSAYASRLHAIGATVRKLNPDNFGRG